MGDTMAGFLFGVIYFSIGIALGKLAVRRGYADDESGAAFIGMLVMVLWPVAIAMMILVGMFVTVGKWIFPLPAEDDK